MSKYIDSFFKSDFKELLREIKEIKEINKNLVEEIKELNKNLKKGK